MAMPSTRRSKLADRGNDETRRGEHGCAELSRKRSLAATGSEISPGAAEDGGVSVFLVLAVGIALWALLIYVIVVEPIRLYLRERHARQAKSAPMSRLKALPRP
jgi:hypothetical protein